jgi:hypothetical protein
MWKKDISLELKYGKLGRADKRVKGERSREKKAYNIHEQKMRLHFL